MLEREDEILISAGTPAEALTVAAARGVGPQMRDLAGLDFGDCFGYALAEQRGCPLLHVGQDFAMTTVASALQP